MARLLVDGWRARPDVVAELLKIGALERAAPPAEPFAPPRASAHVCIVADEPIAAETIRALAALGFTSARHTTPVLGPARADTASPAFVIAQVSIVDAAVRLAHELYERSVPSLWFWRRPDETVVGPVVAPGGGPCWNCLRHRLSDDRIAERSPVESDPSALTFPQLLALHAAFALDTSHGIRSSGLAIIESDSAPTHAAIHTVIALPTCAVCGAGAARDAPRSRPPLATTQPLEPFAPIIDDRTGILRAVVRRPAANDANDAFSMIETYTALMAAYRDDRRALPAMVGAGKGFTRLGAMMSAVGEGLERYSACWYDAQTLRYASPAELDREAFDPRRLVLYGEDQYADPHFPWCELDEHRRIHWTRGTWLDDDSSVWLPALATFLYFPAAREETFCQVTSSGLAAGPTRDSAVLSALYEALERDAFMITWLARREVVGIKIDQEIPPELLALIARIESFGPLVELYSLDVGTEVTTIVCAAFGDGIAWPGVTVGLGTHADPAVALSKAVLEQAHCGPLIRMYMLENMHQRIRTPTDVAIHSDHALYYVDPSRAASFDFMRRSRRSAVSLSSVRSWRHHSLASLARVLARRGIRIAAADLTSPDLRDVPVSIARVLGTDLQPLDFGYGNRRLRSGRLARFVTAGVNPDPHPIA